MLAGLTEVLLVVFLTFVGIAGVLVGVQRLTRKQLPVGCTPVDGECCLQSGNDPICAEELRRRADVEVRDAGA